MGPFTVLIAPMTCYVHYLHDDYHHRLLGIPLDCKYYYIYAMNHTTLMRHLRSSKPRFSFGPVTITCVDQLCMGSDTLQQVQSANTSSDTHV